MMIGEFSRRTGLSADTIRFYVRRGLLVPETGAKGGRNPYQMFTQQHVMAARMIRMGQSLGMPLKQIAALNAEYLAGGMTRERSIEIMAGQLAKLEETAADLETMAGYLRRKLQWLEAGAVGEERAFPCRAGPARPARRRPAPYPRRGDDPPGKGTPNRSAPRPSYPSQADPPMVPGSPNHRDAAWAASPRLGAPQPILGVARNIGNPVAPARRKRLKRRTGIKVQEQVFSRPDKLAGCPPVGQFDIRRAAANNRMAAASFQPRVIASPSPKVRPWPPRENGYAPRHQRAARAPCGRWSPDRRDPSSWWPASAPSA